MKHKKLTRFITAALILFPIADGMTTAEAVTLEAWTGTTFALSGDGTNVVAAPTASRVSEVAWNAGSTSDATVNGVTFRGGTTSTAGVTANGISITPAENISTAPNDQNVGVFAGNFDTLMKTIAFGSSLADREWSITLSGLTDQQQYEVQFIIYQSGGPDTGLARDMQIFFGSDATGLSTGVFNAGGVDDPTGDVRTASFTADGTNQSFYFAGGIPEPDPFVAQVSILNGVAVYSVPEPGSLALLGLGGLCLLRRRR